MPARQGLLKRKDEAMAESVGYLQDDAGNKSAMRLMCIIAMAAAVAFGALVVFRGDPGGNGLYMSAMFLAAAMGGKIGQKALEQPSAPITTVLNAPSIETAVRNVVEAVNASPKMGSFNPLGQ